MLVSGGLGLKALQHVIALNNIVAVMTDKNSVAIIEYCHQENIPFYAGNPRNGKALPFLKSFQFDVLLSVNYLFIIGQELIRLPGKLAVNIHGSLLPKYRGRTPHVWAIINGESKTGITAHVLEAGVDEGDIVHQVEIPIRENDTGASILKKFGNFYPGVIDFILSDIAAGTLNRVAQDSTKATYFGKRSPDDGAINWSWCKERIRNWIRAQAKPYPGAFTFLEGMKIIVHKAEFSEAGFHFDQPNGCILAHTPHSVIVKTPTGAIEISEIEYTYPVLFEVGKILT